MTDKRPPKIEDVIAKATECIKNNNYTFGVHALERLKERRITRRQVEYILQNGYEEKRKTKYDEQAKTWKYAVRGKTKDGYDIRVIIAFELERGFIITVMHVEEYDERH